MGIEILSIDITNQCHKECACCYNSSSRYKKGKWKGSEVIELATDCIKSGVKAISLGGGEPFEHPEIFPIIKAIYPLAYLSVTTNGIPLEDKGLRVKLKDNHPDKIHISIHNPEDSDEVARVFERLLWLDAIGIKSGVNLLVSKKCINQAKSVYEKLREIIAPSQIILLPMRFRDTPSPTDLLRVAGDQPFQSSSCLTGCNKSDNFASVTWDKKVGWCSFSSAKAPLEKLTYNGIIKALNSVSMMSCQGKESPSL